MYIHIYICTYIYVYICMYICVISLSVMSNSVTPWTVAHQAPLSMGILQARILEWVAMPSSRGHSQPRNLTQVSLIAGRFFIIWVTREASVYMYIRFTLNDSLKIFKYIHTYICIYLKNFSLLFKVYLLMSFVHSYMHVFTRSVSVFPQILVFWVSLTPSKPLIMCFPSLKS